LRIHQSDTRRAHHDVGCRCIGPSSRPSARPLSRQER
jgi:hypothetical protein